MAGLVLELTSVQKAQNLAVLPQRMLSVLRTMGLSTPHKAWAQFYSC